MSKTGKFETIQKNENTTLRNKLAGCDFFHESLDLLSANHSLGFFHISRQCEVIEANDTFLKSFFPEDSSNLQILPKDIFDTLFTDLTFGGKLVNCVKKVHLPDGSIIEVVISAKSLYSEGNENIIGFLVENSNEKENNSTFDESVDNLNLLIESVDSPFWSLDLEGNLKVFNNSFSEYFLGRYNSVPGKGMPLFEKFKKFESEWSQLFENALAGHKSHTELKFKINGHTHYFDVVVNPVRNADSQIIGVAFLLHDITGRKTTEKFLLQSKNHLQALINNIPYLVWLKDSEGDYIIVNQSFNAFFKLDADDDNYEKLCSCPIGSEFFKYISNDSEILSNGIKLMEEKSFVFNGETRWFEIHKTPIYTDSRELVGTTGMARDITSRKTIENILLESEERFRQFAENTADAFILCSKESVLYVNPAFEKIFGRPINEAYENIHIPAEWLHPDDCEKVYAHFSGEEYLQTGKFNGQYRIVKPDYSVAWIWERSFPVFNAQNEIIRFISVASDITRQKQLEVDLLKSKSQNQAIIDNIPHQAWLKDLDGKYVAVNESFAKFYSHTKEELVGKCDSDLCHPDLAELYAYNDYLVLKTRKQQQFDEFIDTLEGTVYTETIKTPVINNDDEVIGITGISRDITYYKRLEQQLRANDDRLKALLRNSTDSITVIDKEGKIIFDSSFLFKIEGITSDESKGRYFVNSVVKDDRDIVLNAIISVVNNPEMQAVAEFSCITANGTKLHFESFFTNHSKNALIGGIVINSRDITERKQAELKEKEYQENLVFLENTALEFLSITTSDEIYAYIGRKMHELVPESVVIFSSYNEEQDSLIIQNLTGIEKFMGVVIDFLGRSPLHYHMPLNHQTRREVIATSNKLHELSGGLYNICNRQLDFMVCKALEKLISFNKSYGMGIVRAGKLLGSIVILTRFEHDVRDPRIIETFMYQASIALLRRRVEKEFIIAKEKAEESDRLKTAFLANMSHEIRTPVNGIIGFSQLLESIDMNDEKRKEFIEIIRTNASSLLSLIDDIIDVSIIQEGQVKLRNTTVNINLLLDEVFSVYLSPRYQEKGLELEVVKFLPDEEAAVLMDSLRVKQVLNNLISNAFKFTEEGKIEFGYTIIPGFVRFYVKDTGIGISADKQEVIFQRFAQADITFTRRFGGSGLGLTISKGLVELMGGKIWVESSPNEGSLFCFTIPVCESLWKSPETLAESARSNHSLMN